ncbi:tetratricopeptide repeat protein [Asticcacaulis machinosus]|uniref:Tetratricopeptide repeat protein n=1 Tax=Asticcacaulis machinosus TaxID=2984211 RepID=A0ABT5HGG6_9CAUL|nr:tetratricopeptide repeat protein [Asticcacaulis machinosus]MDC7675334.1 tetratricopeptide repeat protein [Asticcacaulis machinosus]
MSLKSTAATGAFIARTLIISAGLILPASVFAQTTTPTPAAEAPSETTVTVEGKLKPKTAERALRLNPRTASSCNFMSSGMGNSETYLIQDYIAATTGNSSPEAMASAGVTYNDDGTISQGDGNTYFRENSPYGDASTSSNAAAGFMNRFDGSQSTESNIAAYCSPGDLAYTAGRAHIARRDKTLPEAYALFDAKKYPEALEMAKKSYAKLTDSEGGVEASLMIGKIYVYGLHGTADVPEGLKWLERAAGSRFDITQQMPAFDPKYPEDSLTPISEAAVLMAKVYMVGLGVPKNPKEARKWFERANYVGYVPAAKTLGDIYYYGYDTPKDVKKAVEYYTQAAKLGFTPAQYSLAEIYYYGDDGTNADVKTAVAWYYEASRQSHAGALHAVARAYDAGEGVAADPNKALVYYKEAALAGNADAQNAMGTYFYQGGQIAKDDVSARKWFEAAARQGQDEAMFNLAVMMMKGEGGDKDPVMAWVWFRLAQAKGHENAKAALTALEKRMTDADKAQALAILSPPAKS